ncbi:MAG: EscU/YscU/HrcU family type III secretion system export apparatus switch protein [Myxococcaceae bacterium]
MSEKTHQPTQRKLDDARKKGQIPRSKVLSSAVVTVSGLAATLAFAPTTHARLRAWTISMLSNGGASTTPTAALMDSAKLLAELSLPTLAAVLLAAALVSAAQSGLRVQTDAVAPKWERLDAIAGFKKLFSERQLIDTLKGLAIAALVVAFFWNGLSSLAPQAFAAWQHDGAAGFVALLSLLTPLVMKAAVLLLALGVADWALARHRHVKDLMMSHEEVKQEHKNSEGDPKHKSKRKQLHKQLANGGTARGVQKATAVVVNPTHIAIALRYDERECDAPYIVARGQEEDALKIRQEAAAAGIPIVRDIPLARTLIHYDVGEEVPEELYQAAAAILKVALEESEAQKNGGTP